MIQPILILNERDARDARATIGEIDIALSSDEHFAKIAAGLPLALVKRDRRAPPPPKEGLYVALSS